MRTITGNRAPRDEAASGAPRVLGLLGGVGSGKSLVASFFRACGAMVLDADSEAHAVLGEPQVQAEILSIFGSDILDPTGAIDRDALARRVFDDAGDLRRLEGIVHPRVRERLRSQLDQMRRETATPWIVLDIPLLLESPFADVCEEFVFVDASPETREERVRASRGWRPGELARREAHQEPLNKKRARARHVVRNEGAKDITFRQVIEMAQKLLQELEEPETCSESESVPSLGGRPGGPPTAEAPDEKANAPQRAGLPPPHPPERKGVHDP